MRRPAPEMRFFSGHVPLWKLLVMIVTAGD